MSSTLPTTSSTSSPSLSKSAIIGIIVGLSVAVLLVLVAAAFFIRRCNKKRHREQKIHDQFMVEPAPPIIIPPDISYERTPPSFEIQRCQSRFSVTTLDTDSYRASGSLKWRISGFFSSLFSFGFKKPTIKSHERIASDGSCTSEPSKKRYRSLTPTLPLRLGRTTTGWGFDFDDRYDDDGKLEECPVLPPPPAPPPRVPMRGPSMRSMWSWRFPSIRQTRKDRLRMMSRPSVDGSDGMTGIPEGEGNGEAWNEKRVEHWI